MVLVRRHACRTEDDTERMLLSGLLSVAEQIDTRSAAGRLVLNVLASVSQVGAHSYAVRPKTGSVP